MVAPKRHSPMFEESLKRLARDHLLRTLRRVEGEQGPWVSVDGRKVLLLSSNNYLGLANHPKVKIAAAAAIDRYGVGAGAARLISGNTPLHEELEHRLAQFKGTEAALLFSSGYLANLGLPAALLQAGDLVVADRLCHASLIDGCRLARATFRVYPHRDTDRLKRLLARRRADQRVLIVTDGVFSMDGDIAPLPEIVALAKRYGAMVLLDDAHATGVLGESGQGTLEHFHLAHDGDEGIIQMGTLGKAFGTYGAYVAGSRALITYLLNTARTFLFTTAIPPAVAAATLAALDILEQEPERRQRLGKNQRTLAHGLAAAGFTTHQGETPIFPLIVGDPGRTVAMSEQLWEAGIWVPAIRPPTVPAGTSRLRLSVMATHTTADLNTAIQAVTRAGKEAGLL